MNLGSEVHIMEKLVSAKGALGTQTLSSAQRKEKMKLHSQISCSSPELERLELQDRNNEGEEDTSTGEGYSCLF